MEWNSVSCAFRLFTEWFVFLPEVEWKRWRKVHFYIFSCKSKATQTQQINIWNVSRNFFEVKKYGEYQKSGQ